MDIQAAVRLMMNKVNLDAFEGDATVTFFMEWINSVLRQYYRLNGSNDSI